MKKVSLCIKVISCILLAAVSVYSQTASITAGCAELRVEFTAPQASSYYWVFGDGPSNTSDLQNPVHSYVQSGEYTAQLFDQQNGTQVGDDIIITVYPPIMIDIDADERTGCAPLEVNFTSTIDIHPSIVIEDIVWTFGDGNSASGQNATYTYNSSGTFTVSVKVITDASIKCDEPVIFEDYIVLKGENTNFFINKYSSCNVPDDFIFTDFTNPDPGTTYFWDFDNGETSTDVGPHTITYDAEGLYNPELTTTTANGCVSSISRTISIGAPIVLPTFPDTVCIGAEVYLNQNTVAQDFLWDFTGTSIDTSYIGGFSSEEKRPLVVFNGSGLQTFTMTATAVDGCETTVTLDIFVFQPDASYTVGPEESCTDPVLIEFTANDPNLAIYTFNNDFTGNGADQDFFSFTGSSLYTHPDRDEYYINYTDSVSTRLIVTSPQGCLDTAYRSYIIQKPEAFFIPDVIKGCVPFEVNFSDLSYSKHDIQTRDWDFGDGQGGSYSVNDTVVSHVYTTGGFHEAVLTITDVNGCVDVSRRVEIIAIQKDTIPFLGDPIPFPCPTLDYCVGDSILLGVTTDQINANLHIESDEGRFDHCWKEVVANHTFQYPGVYPLDVTFEFYTVYIDSFTTGCNITVLGSRSDINYNLDCSDPYVVNFSGQESINADEYAWYVGDQLISNDLSHSYTFPSRGEYTVYLDTRQNGVNCMHRDSAKIYITDIIADINIPDESCVSSPTALDASGSQDVHDMCRAGYIWQFENQRPREVNDTILNHFLLPGFQTITLIVEDINGCTDTVSATTTAYDLQAEFTADSLICLPSDVALTDLSIGDTTIVSWNWDFGGNNSNLQNPTHTFDSLDYDPNLQDSITVTLTVEDAIGCTDQYTFWIETYDIFSEIIMDNGPILCQNQEISFNATDYNQGGSFLNYFWDFGANGTSNINNPTITFTEAGEQLITLTFTEDASGCMGTIDTLINVIPTPTAGFTSDQDSVEFICFPEQIAFTNTSVGNIAAYFWDFNNGAESNIEDPIIPFDKGTYEVQLIVSTTEGCRDTISRTYTLVGPEGSFTVDKDVICPGEEITLTLGNTVDVSSYTWDFGDGVQIDDQSPVTHTYNNESSVSEFTPTLILRSDENGCELIQDIPINVSSITADFIDSTGVCPGELTFYSDFIDAQSIEWNIDGQVITGTSNPSVAITTNDPTIEVVLNVTDSLGCIIERSRTIEVPELDNSAIKFPNVFSPNGDDINPTFNIVYDENELEGEVEVVEFKVYNRWGELIYNNENPALGWDGSYKGKMVPPDVYAYYIEVALNGCIPKSRKGNVTVIK